LYSHPKYEFWSFALIIVFIFYLFSARLVTAAGKMVVLDRLLCKLRGRGHRVVIFSQVLATLLQ
jgi:SNF2 family DNA or RNA helicase